MVKMILADLVLFGSLALTSLSLLLHLDLPLLSLPLVPLPSLLLLYGRPLLSRLLFLPLVMMRKNDLSLLES